MKKLFEFFDRHPRLVASLRWLDAHFPIIASSPIFGLALFYLVSGRYTGAIIFGMWAFLMYSDMSTTRKFYKARAALTDARFSLWQAHQVLIIAQDIYPDFWAHIKAEAEFRDEQNKRKPPPGAKPSDEPKVTAQVNSALCPA